MSFQNLFSLIFSKPFSFISKIVHKYVLIFNNRLQRHYITQQCLMSKLLIISNKKSNCLSVNVKLILRKLKLA